MPEDDNPRSLSEVLAIVRRLSPAQRGRGIAMCWERLRACEDLKASLLLALPAGPRQRPDLTKGLGKGSPAAAPRAPQTREGKRLRLTQRPRRGAAGRLVRCGGTSPRPLPDTKQPTDAAATGRGPAVRSGADPTSAE